MKYCNPIRRVVFLSLRIDVRLVGMITLQRNLMWPGVDDQLLSVFKLLRLVFVAAKIKRVPRSLWACVLVLGLG